ncbi:MAG: TraM recognition domain-containing protein, partial [Candidatus Rokuibacteriota bacterium]
MTKRHGLETMMPYLRQQASDPLEVVRVASWLAQGVVLGTKLDPATREPRGQAVVEPTHTAVVIGASGIGKTTGLVAPYAALRASVGDNVVVVTPQPPTIGLILPTAKALSGQDHVPVIDFGGEIVGRESPEFRAWDVTRNCLDVERAMEFADSFAGPKVPAREHLTNPEYWGGMVWDMYAAAGHIAAGMRELQGLDPHGLNGMARVYDLLRSSRAEDLRTKLHAELQAALEGSPAQLRRQEALVQAATEHAERFHPRLQRIAFNEYMLREAGVPLSDEIVGETLESLNEALGEIAKARSGDPMESLLKSFKRAVPLRERLVMSPRPGDNEIDPSDLVRPGAGISFVAYAHRGSTGLAAGAFTSQVLDAAMSRSKDAGMLRSIGGQGVDARLSLVVDEGGAGRHIPRLPDVVTDARQGGISALVSMTSEHHLRSVFGDEDAGKFLHAPCVIDMSPDPDRAADIAQLFGDHVVERRSESSGVGVGSVTWSEQKEDLLGAADVTRI